MSCLELVYFGSVGLGLIQDLLLVQMSWLLLHLQLLPPQALQHLSHIFCLIIFEEKKPSAMGACIGAVVGLVAITPAAGFVSIAHSLVIGICAAVTCNLMITWRSKTSIDDTLDVFPSHGIGGIVGMLLTGVFASREINPAIENQGLFFGEARLFLAESLTLIGVSIYVFMMTWLILILTNWISPIRVNSEDENIGLDQSQHDESL